MTIVTKSAAKIPDEFPSEQRMVVEFYRHFERSSRYVLSAPNIYVANASYELDFFGIRKSGYCDEVEIKRSVADFKNDFKKSTHRIIRCPDTRRVLEHYDETKHETIAKGEYIANYFSFLIPHELLDKVDVPEHCGIYTIVPYMYGSGNYNIVEERRPKLMHRNKVSDAIRLEVATKMHYRYWDSLKTKQPQTI